MIMGLSGVGGLFTETCIKNMYKHCDKPIIFPMSNPTSSSECTAEEAYKWTDGNAILASGSPFDPVEINGITKYPAQANNMFIFPGLGLACSNIGIRRISDAMLSAYRMIITLIIVQQSHFMNHFH